MIPDIIEMFIRDTVNLLKFVISFLKGPKALSSFLFKRWLEKY